MDNNNYYWYEGGATGRPTVWKALGFRLTDERDPLAQVGGVPRIGSRHMQAGSSLAFARVNSAMPGRLGAWGKGMPPMLGALSGMVMLNMMMMMTMVKVTMIKTFLAADDGDYHDGEDDDDGEGDDDDDGEGDYDKDLIWPLMMVTIMIVMITTMVKVTMIKTSSGR